MKFNYKKFLYVPALAALLAAGGCGENDLYPSQFAPGSDPSVPQGVMVDAAVTGFVTDVDGKPLQGVQVTTGTATAVTSSNGMFELEQFCNVDERAVVKFEKSGYFPVVRSMTEASADNNAWTVRMASTADGKYVRNASFDASKATSVQLDNLKIDFPADGFKYADDNKHYSGIVKASVFHLSPEMEGFSELMPGGDLAALNEYGSEVQLVSYGMANVVMTDESGKKLQLEEGSQARVRFEIPESMAANAPSTIPLWSFNEHTGLWVEEQTASRVSPGVYEGEASHFSWLNIDEKEDRSWIEGYVHDTDGRALSGLRIYFNHQFYTVTDKNGHYRSLVQANSRFDVTIDPIPATGGYGKGYTAQVGPIPSGETLNHDITLQKTYMISGLITNQYGEPVCAIVRYDFGNGISGLGFSDHDGNYAVCIPEGFSGNADLAVEPANGQNVTATVNCPLNRDVTKNFVVNVNGGAGTDYDIIIRGTDGLTRYMKVDRVGANQLGGVIIDGGLTAINNIDFDDSDDYDMGNIFMVIARDYTVSKDSYSGVRVAASKGSETVVLENAEGTIKREGKNYIFYLSGNGYYVNQRTNTAVEAAITVDNVDMSHLVTVEGRTDYTPASPFASFTPKLSAAAPVAGVVSDSEKLGKGGVIYYNGSKSDYTNLVNQASKSGLTYAGSEEDSGYAEAAWFKGTSALTLEYDSYAEPISASSYHGQPLIFPIDDESDELESQIIVISFSGGTLGLDVTRSAASANAVAKIRSGLNNSYGKFFNDKASGKN